MLLKRAKITVELYIILNFLLQQLYIRHNFHLENLHLTAVFKVAST
jgi:hypothetical protein